MKQNLTVPIAIIVAGALVAGALFLSGRNTAPSQPADTVDNTLAAIPAVTSNDHILGNPDADVVIIEYTDLECPFCKQFHTTMQQIIDEYGADGKVAWVLRNFPLTQIHPNAPRIAEGAECVAQLAGNGAYWEFIDEVFTVAPINTFFPIDRLGATAEKVGVAGGDFDQCLAGGAHRSKIENQFNDAVAGGGQGTPFNVIILKSGERVAVPGAYPYTDMRNIVESALSGGNATGQ